MTRTGTRGVDEAPDHQESGQGGANHKDDLAGSRLVQAARGVRVAHQIPLFGAWVLGEGVDALKELLVEDENETEHEQHEKWRDNCVYQPVPAFLLARGDPALDWRQPKDQQEEAARRVLVEALMEDGVTIAGEPGAV